MTEAEIQELIDSNYALIANANRIIAATEGLITEDAPTSVSLCLVCDYMDRGWASLLSQVMCDMGLVSDPDGFCLLETDADHGLCIRSVTVPELIDAQLDYLLGEFDNMEWEYRDIVTLTVRQENQRTERHHPMPV